AFKLVDGRTMVPLNLPANGSVFVVFREATGRGESRAGENRVELNEGAPVDGPWRVTFDPRWGGAGQVVFDSLSDWSKSRDNAIRYYSGVAVYEQTFVTPADHRRGEPLWLDLGEVKNMARVIVNGEDLGVVWTAPFRKEISSAINPGPNQLRVEVVNLWPNRLIRDAQLPPEQRLTKTNIQKFKGHEALLRSGLLGPVRLLSRAQSPKAEGGLAKQGTQSTRPEPDSQ
ncbi:MAG: hypothetical protein KDA37_12975, partial [Planctomycetales bacterium]|nr:hypothetical protein [Planctomycetales bacterium]